MLDLRTPEEMALIPAIDLSSILSRSPGREAECAKCEAYRPEPQLSGNQQVDPEMHLPGPLPLDISIYYNAASTSNIPYGYGRTISAYQTAQASGSPTIVTLTRGNGAVVSYQYDSGTAKYIAATPGCLNSLSQNGTYWQETTLDGMVLGFPFDTTGQITSLAYQQDPAGNILTNLYSSGILQNIQDGAGRLVTFGYSGSLLQTIQDWANRTTTFQYNT